MNVLAEAFVKAGLVTPEKAKQVLKGKATALEAEKNRDSEVEGGQKKPKVKKSKKPRGRW
jgi:hypothetical protein